MPTKKSYCGAKDPPPKGTKRGTLEYCKKKKQVRYYGIEKVDRDALEPEVDIDDERQKAYDMYIKLLAKKRAYDHQKMIHSIKTTTPAKKRKAAERMRRIEQSVETLQGKYRRQRDYVLELERERDSHRRRQRRAGGGRSSGSKSRRY